MRKRGELYNLLLALLLVLLAYPFFTGKSLAGRVFAVFFTWVLISAVYAVSRDNKRNFLISLVMFAPTALFLWADQFVDNRFVDILGFMFMIAFTFFTVFCILSYILKEKKVTGNILAGAASIYLLLGISWSLLYAFLEFLKPGSFIISKHIIKDMTEMGWSTFNYYSFVTLTTLGYGDITPATMHAQSLAILEAAAGVLFTALLISRLVGMYLHQLGEGVGAPAGKP